MHATAKEMHAGLNQDRHQRTRTGREHPSAAEGQRRNRISLRAARCHNQRCLEADQDIRDAMRRY